MKITSQPLVFLDTTDSRKLEVYISSNHPTTQLYNENNQTNKHTPDWSKTNLKLSADIFLDSEEITPQKKKWYRQAINETTETLISTGDHTDEITISTNMTSAIVTYICRVEYQGLTAFAKITFTRTDVGLNGTNGKDGTSVRILGTATDAKRVDDTDYYTITYSSSAITAAEPGDAYLYNGNLYVCAVKRDGDDYFINVGNIQGPPGQKGTDAKLITLSSSSQVFKVSNTGTVTPATITVTATAINTSVSTWTYSTDGGKTFAATVPAGLSRNGNTITVTGSTLSANSVVIKASDGTYGDTLTVHKVVDGAVGAKGDSASMAFLTNENISFAANAGGQISATSLTTNVVAYHGTQKVMPTVGTPSSVPSGMTISVDSTSLASSSKEVILTISIADDATLGSASSNHGTVTIPITSPVSTNLILSWSKINAGESGTPGLHGTDAVTFNVYSNDGYALSINTPAITLQTFAYIGDVAIVAGAEYQWYRYSSSGWSAITDATKSYYAVSRDNVSFSNSYMCKMQFNGAEYVGVATIDDKSDENKVFTTKPSNYTAGDLWIVGSDYKPSGVEVGTLLKAQHTNKTYADADWINATRYDEQLQDLQDNLTQYNQYFSFNSTDGVRITAKDNNGVESKYSTTISNDRWAINYGSEAVTYVDETKMHIKEAEIESPLTITGKYSGSNTLQAPIINIGDFSLVIENDGSLSVVVKT